MAICAGITYDGVNDRIIVQYNAADGSKGASYINPYTLDDVYDTAIDLTLDVVRTVVDTYTLFDLGHGLYILGAATYFNAYSSGLTWHGMAGSKIVLDGYDNAHIKFGVAGTSTTPLGFDIFHSDSAVAYYYMRFRDVAIEFHHCSISYMRVAAVYGFAGNNAIMDNCKVLPYSTFDLNGQYLELTNSSFVGGGFLTVNLSITIFENIYLSGCRLYTNWIQEVVTVKNIRMGGTARYYGLLAGGTNKRIRLVDCPDAPIEFGNHPTYATSDYTYEEVTTLNTYVENGDGAELVIYDKDDNVLYNETLSGNDMTEQEIIFKTTRGDHENGAASGDIDITITDYQPLRLAVSRNGFQPLEIPNINIVKGVPTNLLAQLIPPVYADPPPEVEIDEEPTTIAIIEIETE